MPLTSPNRRIRESHQRRFAASGATRLCTREWDDEIPSPQEMNQTAPLGAPPRIYSVYSTASPESRLPVQRQLEARGLVAAAEPPVGCIRHARHRDPKI